MSFLNTKDWAEARRRVQGNADYFGVPFVLFIDTNGNFRGERYQSQKVEGQEIIQPKAEDDGE